MQYTLIPLKEKILLRKEYTLRLLIALLFLLAGIGFIGALGLFPALLKVSIAEHNARAQSNITGDAQNLNIEELEKTLKEDDGLLAAASKEVPPRLSFVIYDVTHLRGPVKLNSISIERSEKNGIIALVRGVSPTRDALIAFKNRMIAEQPSISIDLPLSELTKSADIPFSLTIKETLQ